MNYLIMNHSKLITVFTLILNKIFISRINNLSKYTYTWVEIPTNPSSLFAFYHSCLNAMWWAWRCLSWIDLPNLFAFYVYPIMSIAEEFQRKRDSAKKGLKFKEWMRIFLFYSILVPCRGYLYQWFVRHLFT